MFGCDSSVKRLFTEAAPNGQLMSAASFECNNDATAFINAYANLPICQSMVETCAYPTVPTTNGFTIPSPAPGAVSVGDDFVFTCDTAGQYRYYVL